MSTIAAIATPRGEGGIAIVRVSGEAAERVLKGAFRPAGHKKAFEYESHRLYFGHVIDDEGGVIDEAMAVLMRAPRSYTREDVAEIHCHGGSAAADRVLRRTLALGAVPAAPVFLHGHRSPLCAKAAGAHGCAAATVFSQVLFPLCGGGSSSVF